MANSGSGRKKSQSRLETSLKRRKKSEHTGSNISELRQPDEQGSKQEERPKTSTDNILPDVRSVSFNDKPGGSLMDAPDKTKRQLLEEIKVLRSKNTRLERANHEIPDFADEPQKSNAGKVITDRLILIGIGLGVFFWILESVIHAYLFHDKNLIDQLVRPDTNEIWMRLVVCIILICFSVYAHSIIKQLQQIKMKLQQFNNKLEYGIRERTAELTKTNEKLVTEITERNKAEKQIEKQNEFLKLTIESLTHPFCVIDAKDYTIRIANTAARMGNICKGQICYKLTHKQDMPCNGPDHLCPLEEIKRTKQPVTVEHKHYDENGEPRVVEVHAYPALDEQGNLEQIIEYSLDITERKQVEDKLFEYQSNLLSLVTQLTMAEEHQRREIATELHDNASQEVALALMKLENMREKAKGEQLQSLDDICKLMRKAVENIREMTFDICSPTLYKFGLETAIAELLDEKLGARNKIRYNFDDDAEIKTLSEDIKIVLFQSVRELVNNIIKHASAKNVTVEIRKIKDTIRITVSDDGVGFAVEELESSKESKRGFGLFSIAERIKYIGGSFEFQSQPKRGSSFSIEAPLAIDVN